MEIILCISTTQSIVLKCRCTKVLGARPTTTLQPAENEQETMLNIPDGLS
jgi:hypothetical protein